MKRKNLTRNALFTSIISLLLCVSMLVGTTFAWFTDSVASGVNTIAAGNLDVKLYHGKDKNPDDEVDQNTLLFTDVGDNVIDRWEPGVVAFTNLKVANVGTLALKYQLSVNSTEVNYVTTADGAQLSLADALKVAVVDGGVDGGNRAGVIAAGETAGWQGLQSFTKSGVLESNETSKTYGIVIYWQPGDNAVDNQFNMNNGKTTSNGEPLTITLGVNLFATQEMYEDDSFGPDYDEDAWHPDMTVYTVEELSKALASGGKIQVIGTLNAGATQDVPNWTNAPAEFIFDATTLDALKGGDYILDEGSKYGVVALISAGESLALSDMKITANSQWPVYLSNYGGNLDVSNVTIEAEAGAGIYPYGTNGTTVLNNVKVNQNYLDPAYSATTPWAATAVATSNGHNLVINSGTYIGSEWAVYGYNSGSTITINGGTFKAPKVIQLDGVWSGSNKSVATINGGNFDGSIYLDWGTNVPELYINGGNFTNFSATVCGAAKLVITGGSFDADPSAYVAEGYKAVESNGKYIVVSENAIATSDDLIVAINAANDGDTLLLAPGEYSLRFTNNTTFNVDNLNIKGMDNAKLTVSSSEAWYGRVQGDNVTFENIHFTSSVGATGKATYNNCTFDDWTICASSGNKETYFNNCDIKGTLNTSTDFSSGNTYVTDSTVAKAEFSGAATMYFTNCKIGELISWDMATVLKNCDVEKQDMKMKDQKVTTIETDKNGLSLATNNADPDALVLYEVPSDYAKTTLAVPEGVTAIGNYAFAYNSKVETVNLPTTVTDLGRGFDSSSVKKVVLNEGLETISSRAFKSTTALEEVVISSSVKEIADNAFQKSGIKEIVIPANVETIGETAFGSSKIEKVTIEGNTSIQGYAFRGCPNLKEVHLNGDVTFIASTLNGRNSTWFCNGESNNTNVSDITFYVVNETVAKRVKDAMGVDTGKVEIYVNGVLYEG